jgi:hypothetical protein
MKILNDQDQESIHESKKKEEGRAIFVGEQKKIKGLKMFEFNPYTTGIRQIEPLGTDAEFVQPTNLLTGKKLNKQVILKEKYHYNPNFMYTQATNLDNAVKKFGRFLEKQMKKHQKQNKS